MFTQEIKKSYNLQQIIEEKLQNSCLYVIRISSISFYTRCNLVEKKANNIVQGKKQIRKTFKGKIQQVLMILTLGKAGAKSKIKPFNY